MVLTCFSYKRNRGIIEQSLSIESAMPKGFHFGRSKRRRYTSELYKLPAKAFKELLTSKLGTYQLDGEGIPASFKQFELKQHNEEIRYAAFKRDNDNLEIALLTCSKSVSTKLYITCPFCQNQKQHLYIFTNGFACRNCLNLNYASQSERKQDRLARRIRKLRGSIWGGLANVHDLTESARYYPKPKNKHWVKFECDKAVLNKLERKYWILAEAQMDKLLSI